MYLAIEIAFIVLQLVLIAISVRALRRSARRTMYSYKNISLVASIIFFSVCFLSNLISVLTWQPDIPFELYHVLGFIISSFTSFANVNTLLVLPFFFIYAIISNTVLLKKEGKSLPNLLGFLLCIVLLIGSSAVFFSYDVLDHFMNVHSYEGYCFSLWIESLFAILVSYFECLLFATFYVSIKARRHIPTFDKDYMIILGCHVREDGKPAGLLRGRIDRAREFAKLQKKETKRELVFVPSGGKGLDEPIAEATSMKNYLLEKHVPESLIIAEDESKTTLENFRFSKKKIKTTDHVAFATSAYHVFRAGVIAAQAGFTDVEGIGSKSPWYYHNSALIREFIANLNSEKWLHLKNVVAIIFSLGTIILAGYLLDAL